MTFPLTKNLHYNKKLRQFARCNRKEMTKAEACLWKFILSNKKMLGYQFRRQRAVSKFIADFMCKELMLIIEIDGLTHQWEEIALNDLERQQALEQLGFNVVRYDDDDVLNHINNVHDHLVDYIRKLSGDVR